MQRLLILLSSLPFIKRFAVALEIAFYGIISHVSKKRTILMQSHFW